MTKEEILAIVCEHHDRQEAFYCGNGPGKHEQEDYYDSGFAVVGVNVGLLSEWLQTHSDEAQESYEDLPKADRRKIWEASNFHFGITGYDTDDADFWWKRERK